MRKPVIASGPVKQIPVRKVTVVEIQDALHHRPRDVQFEWSGLPLHWVPGAPQVTHTLNVMHFLLPEAEHWICKVFQRALPMVRDERLANRVRGFIGQELVHAREHEAVQTQLRLLGLDGAAYIHQLRWLHSRVLDPQPGLTPARRREQVCEAVAIAAAFEHSTAFIGAWLLDNSALDRTGAHSAMLDMLRWHGAEEVEHSSVAFDLLQHLDPGLGRRWRASIVGGTLGLWMWFRGVSFLMATDPELHGSLRWSLRAHQSAAQRGLLPSLPSLLRHQARFLRKGYHPSKEFDIERALAYLALSPAARTADGL